ncbi:hypothetical protein JOQ06_019676, partial [Pogonophryne albipinna]
MLLRRANSNHFTLTVTTGSGLLQSKRWPSSIGAPGRRPCSPAEGSRCRWESQ